jgi:hypothetical protein
MLWFVPDGESQYREEGYTLRIDLLNRGAGICEASGAIGHLDEETILKIGKKAMEFKFRILQCHAVKGKRVSHHLTKIGSDEQCDYYTVDLKAKARELGIPE